MVLARVGVRMVERDSKNGYHQSHIPRCSPSCTVPLQEMLQKQQAVLAQASFKLLISLALKLSEILCTPFENSLCLQFPVYLNVNPSGFQSQTFWGISYQNRELDVGAKTPVSWRRTSMVVIFLLFVGGQPQGMGPS